MLLALGAALIVLLVLFVHLAAPSVWRRLTAAASAVREREPLPPPYDPGRELRAEQRARELLRSCVNEEEWEMYRDLGFIRVWGGLERRPRPPAGSRASQGERAPEADYAYLLYPHRPLIAYLPQTRRILNEYCVTFEDESRPYGSPRLPAADDVLAKWIALTADERKLIGEANMHLPGRQVDPAIVARDLGRLERWERQRLALARRSRTAEKAEDRSR